MKAKFLIPLALFLGLAVFLAIGLTRDPRAVPSPLIDKPAPAFTLPKLDKPDQALTLDDFKGQVWVLNFWASWCVPCRAEHPVLLEMKKAAVMPLVGVSYRDKPEAANKYLQQFGDPNTVNLMDANAKVGIDFGVYGVPETYVIDAAGRIRLKHTGPLQMSDWTDKILPLVKQLQAQKGS